MLRFESDEALPSDSSLLPPSGREASVRCDVRWDVRSDVARDVHRDAAPRDPTGAVAAGEGCVSARPVEGGLEARRDARE